MEETRAARRKRGGGRRGSEEKAGGKSHLESACRASLLRELPGVCLVGNAGRDISFFFASLKRKNLNPKDYYFLNLNR